MAALGTWAVSMTMFGSAATTPAMGSLFAAFADQPQWAVSLINTLPSMTTILGCILFGAVVGKKLKFRTAAIVGLLLYGVFGIMPAFWNNSLIGILIMRAVTGLGIGFVMPFGATWFLRMVRDREERGKYLSWNNAFGSGGSVILTLLGGWFAAINWNWTFLAYLFVFVALIIVLICFKEPKSIDQIIKEEGISSAADFEQAKRVKIGGIAWLIIVIFFLYQMFMTPSLMIAPVMMELTTAADPGLVGTLMTLFSISTAITSTFGGWLIDKLGKFATPISLLITAIGGFCIAFATTLPIFALGFVLLGVGTVINAFINFEIGLVVSVSGVAWAASLLMVASNLGNFFSSFWLGFTQGIGGPEAAANFPIVFSSICLIGLAIIFLIMNIANKKAWSKEAIESDRIGDDDNE